MPVVSRSGPVAATEDRVWEMIADPGRLPRWWPGVQRVESGAENRFTMVSTTSQGRTVRSDFEISDAVPEETVRWSQLLRDSPQAGVLRSCEIAIRIEPAPTGTLVTIEQRLRLRGWSVTGGWMLKRATRDRLDQALAALAATVR